MTGREPQRHNDLFYLCALIEYIARATKKRVTQKFIQCHLDQERRLGRDDT